MNEISAALVKELRDETNVGMMECKRALVEAGGDKARAIQILRERGLAVASKKASRAANNGVIAASVSADGRIGVMLEVNCETDFVARNEVFRAFVAGLLRRAEQSAGDLAAEAADAVRETIQKTGENIVLRRHLRLEAGANGRWAAYVHLGDKLGVLAELEVQGAAAAPQLADIARDVTLHLAACRPPYLRREDVPAAVLAAEKEIYAKQVSNKPPAIVEKIVQGKIEKYFSSVCLLEQPFVKDDKVSVGTWLEAKGRELGAKISVRRYVIWALGE
ncbi:MAG: translation elongation factor Ts [Kiritimatiellae bacterium]|nr:translation elongation factor Ts [Kiritimatiellia bacterium]